MTSAATGSAGGGGADLLTFITFAAGFGIASVVLAAAGLGVALLVVNSRRGGPKLVPVNVPLGAPLSPDGLYWWDGASWRPTR